MMSVVSCKDEQNTIIFKNDIDNFAAWVDYNLYGKHYTDSAYSGKYVNILNPTNPYSTTFYQRIKDICDQKINEVEIKAMVYCKDKIPISSVVLDIWDHDSKSKFFYGVDVSDFVVKPNKWYLCKARVNLKEVKNITEEDFLRIYLKNDGASNIYVDDISITIKD